MRAVGPSARHRQREGRHRGGVSREVAEPTLHGRPPFFQGREVLCGFPLLPPELREEVAALRGTQNVLAMFNEKNCPS